MLILQPILAVLRSIPWWAYALAAALAWGGWQRYRANSSAEQVKRAQETASEMTIRAQQEVIAETERRLTAQKRIIANADQSTKRARAAAADAASAAGGLRAKLAAVQSAASAAGPSAAFAGEASRLADVLGQCADRYTEVAAAADRSILAGRACEQSYSSLTDSVNLPADSPETLGAINGK